MQIPLGFTYVPMGFNANFPHEITISTRPFFPRILPPKNRSLVIHETSPGIDLGQAPSFGLDHGGPVDDLRKRHFLGTRGLWGKPRKICLVFMVGYWNVDLVDGS